MRKKKPDVLRAFGLNVRELRTNRGYSQEELARRSRLDRTYMGGVERGERNIGLLNVCKIAVALAVSPAELMTGING